MKKILFIRKYKKISGGQIKVRDYFLHCLRYPGLDPHIYFTPDSQWQDDPLWAQVPRAKVVAEIALAHFDILFLAGKDWDYLPPASAPPAIINFIQHVKHGDPNSDRFQYLARPALRLCVSEEVRAAIAPYVNGEAAVIQNGVPLDLFAAGADKTPASILIWARKNPGLGAKLRRRLEAHTANVAVLDDYVPREEFAQALARSDIFVALPHATEGFYLPALEAMAAGCAVVCSDAVGNRKFCRHEETCLMPEFDHVEQHVAMTMRLIGDFVLKEKLRAAGSAIAQSYSLETERAEFYRFLERYFFAGMAG